LQIVIAELKEDLQIVIRFTKPNVVMQAREYSKLGGPTSAEDLSFQQKCGKFAEKYSKFEGK
jgi:hypothetical protein